MLLPALAKAKSKAQRIKCVNNLKNVGLAFRTYATDNQDSFPMNVNTNSGGTQEWMGSTYAKYLFLTYRSLSNELSTPKIIICPTDNKTEATNWDSHLTAWGNSCISYGLGIEAQETYPSMILSFDRNVTNSTASGGVAMAKDPSSSIYGKLGTNQPSTGGAGWADDMHQNNGNVALGDGSVQGLSSTRLKEQLRNSGDANNLIMLPYKGIATSASAAIK